MKITVTENDSGKRLDLFVSEVAEITRSAAQRLIESGNIQVNGKAVSKSSKTALNDVVDVDIPEPEPTDVVPQNIPIDIVYEDEDIIVVNKPKGMVVHPAAGNPDGTLVNALLYHCGERLSGIGGVLRPGIVHRIDKDTSGLLVVAKNDNAHNFLAGEIKEHKVSRVYHALANGKFRETSGTVDAPVGRHPVDRKKMAVYKTTEHAREAVTHYSVIGEYEGFTHLRLELETGRTHQIRVHMASLGHPLAGDEVYGGGHSKFERQNANILCGQCLHAKELVLKHPKTLETMHFETELPEYFTTVLGKLK